MKRESWLFSGLFLVSLGLAWWASMPAATKDDNVKSVVSIVSAQIGSVEFTSGDTKVEVKSQGDDRWWIETLKAGVKEGFLGSSKVKDVLNQFNPLEAVRVIGAVKDEGLGEYGLAGTAAKTMRILDRSGAALLSLAIGKQAYGTRNIFVQDLKDKSVMLITGEFVGDLEKAELRMYERTFTNIQMDEVQTAVISYQDKSKKLFHTRRDEKGGLLWTNESAEGSANAAAKSWFERLDRTRIVSFAKDQELDTLKSAKPVFEVELTGAGGAKDTFVFVKITSNPGKKAAPGGIQGDSGLEYYVHSKFLGTWAKVASARLEPIEKDLPTVVTQ